VELVAGRADRLSEELGDLLFALAQFARRAGIDPEAALRAAGRCKPCRSKNWKVSGKP
jgi:ATP diphosphatase